MAKLPEFKDWKAPWEIKGTEFDADTAKKFIYDLHRDVESEKERVATVTSERDALKRQQSEEARKGESETDKLKRQLAEAEASKGETLRLRVALKKGLTENQAKRLLGETEDELSADADSLLADFGASKEKKHQDSRSNQDDEDDENEDELGDEGDLRRLPRRLFNNATGTGAGEGQHVISVEEALEKKIPRRGMLGI